MLTIADVYIWVKDNSSWLWMLVPLVIVVGFFRMANNVR